MKLFCYVSLTIGRTKRTWKGVRTCYNENCEPFWNWKVTARIIFGRHMQPVNLFCIVKLHGLNCLLLRLAKDRGAKRS